MADAVSDGPVVRRLTAADLPQLIDCQAAATAGLPCGFVRAKTAAELLGYLEGRTGMAFGVPGDRGLAATALLRLPSVSCPNPRQPFPLVPEGDWPCHAAFLENTAVRSAARGQGHQRSLVGARLHAAAKAGMRWVCAGVHLENRVSWFNLLRAGMVIAGIRSDQGYPIIGLLRALGPAGAGSDPDDHCAVAANDAAGHEAALQRGYVGVGLLEGDLVAYERLRCRPDAVRG